MTRSAHWLPAWRAEAKGAARDAPLQPWLTCLRLLDLAQESGEAGFFAYQFRPDRLVWTAGLARLFERPAEHFESTLAMWLSLLAADDRVAFEQALEAALAQHEAGPLELQLRVTLPDQRVRHLSARVRLCFSEELEPIEMLGAVCDVTPREEARQAQREHEQAARQRANVAHQAQDDFLSMLGHELRNPLSAISAGVEVLQRRGAPDPVARSALDIIARQTLHLGHMMADMLDVTGALSGKLRLEKQIANLKNVLEQVVRSLELGGRARPGRITLDAQVLWAEVDVARLEQVITHLLANAIKYTPAEAPIFLKAWASGDEAVIQVKDAGPGIPPELLSQVFDLFAQGERPLDRRAGGLGIGLTLVKRLVDLHGGTVHATSSESGCCFEVRLAMAGAPAAIDGDEPVSGSNARRILVVEDNEDAQKTLCDMLLLDGHAVSSADDGVTGLDMLVQQRPEVAIVDIGLPRLDGFEVALRARAAGYAGRMIAVSGYGHAQDAHRAMCAGFDAHMPKPVNAEQLRRLMAA
jgi:signal transduction histidine kinase